MPALHRGGDAERPDTAAGRVQLPGNSGDGGQDRFGQGGQGSANDSRAAAGTVPGCRSRPHVRPALGSQEDAIPDPAGRDEVLMLPVG